MLKKEIHFAALQITSFCKNWVDSGHEVKLMSNNTEVSPRIFQIMTKEKPSTLQHLAPTFHCNQLHHPGCSYVVICSREL